jgi:hypothetical protein
MIYKASYNRSCIICPIKHNTRNIIHQDTRIKKLEEKPVVQPVIQPVTESGQIKTLTADILRLVKKTGEQFKFTMNS